MDFLSGFTGVTVSIVTVLYVLNIFNIDLIGAYDNTAVVERAQFFSTLGQKDFNAGYLSVALPLVFYAFLTAKGRRRTVLYGIPACFGALALAVVDAEGLTLGIGTAMMVLACHKDFDTKKMRRGAVVGVMFFAWAAWMHWMRRSVYTQGGTSLLARFGELTLALPLGLACLAIWAGLAWRAHRGRAGSLPLPAGPGADGGAAGGRGRGVFAGKPLAGFSQPGRAGQLLCLQR